MINRFNDLLRHLPNVADDLFPDHLKVFATTWNLQGMLPDEGNLEKLFQVSHVKHDVYVLGTQEAVRTIA